MKKVLIFSLMFFILVPIILCCGCKNDEVDGTFVRFVVASDVHLTDSDDVESERLKELYDSSYAYAESKINKNVDAYFFAGDFTNSGTDTQLNKFKDISNSKIKQNSKYYTVLGNHEFYTDSTIKERYQSILDTELNWHKVINGFHFIGISPSNSNHQNYAYDSQVVSWLDRELDLALKSDSTKKKPIFLFQHHHIKDTVYGSYLWGTEDLTNVLNKYPQIVDFSGHSHYPINDPRSIWQGNFTALGTGSLSYYELSDDENNAIFPANNGEYSYNWTGKKDAAQYYIVEVTNNTVKILGYDLLSKSFICEYEFDFCQRKYTNLRYNNPEKPFFDSSSFLQAKNITSNSFSLVIPQAKCSLNEKIKRYDIEIYNGSTKVLSSDILSNYFYIPNPTYVQKEISNLSPNVKYTINVYAISCFNGKSDPITFDITLPI